MTPEPLRPAARAATPTPVMPRPAKGAPLGAAARLDVLGPHCRDRSDLRRTPGGEPGRADRDTDARQERHDDGLGGDDDRAAGDLEAHRTEQALDGRRDAETGEQPEHRCEEPDDSSLGEHRAQDLPAARADCPEQGHLTRTLGDDDREGVGDDEGTYEDRDVGEHHQERGDEPHLLAGVGLLLLGDRVAGEHLGARGQRRLDARHELCLRRAVGGEDANRVDLTGLGQQALCCVGGEQARLRAAHAVGRAELRDARDREDLGVALRQDRDLVADAEVTVVSGVLVDHDVTRKARRPPLGEVIGVELGDHGPRHADGGRALGGVAEHLAVLADDLRVALDVPGGAGDAGRVRDRLGE